MADNMEVDWTYFLEEDSFLSGMTINEYEEMATAPPHAPSPETQPPAPQRRTLDMPEQLDSATINPSLLIHSSDEWNINTSRSDNLQARPDSTTTSEVLQNGHIDSMRPPSPILPQANSIKQSDDRSTNRNQRALKKTNKARSRLPSSAVAILNAWLQDHTGNPYPSESEKLELAARSTLELNQVHIWFRNARRRILNPDYESSASASDAESLVSFTSGRGRSSKQAAAIGRSSSVESLSSGFSQSDSERNRPPKRGRKRQFSSDVPTNHRKRSRSTATNTAASGSETDSNFQCTFCKMSLSSKAWRRHEETLHVPQVYWQCMKIGPLLPHRTLFLGSKCAFCGDHVDLLCAKEHRVTDCLHRNAEERVFYRKENLRQHIEKFHPNSRFDNHVASAWECKADVSSDLSPDGTWVCGFCGKVLPDWNSRQIHIAHHFRNGSTMDSWDANRKLLTGTSNQADHSLATSRSSAGEGESLTSTCPDAASTGLRCPHVNCTPLTFGEHCMSRVSCPSEVQFPLQVSLCYARDPFWLWFCKEQNALILQSALSNTGQSSPMWVICKMDSLGVARVRERGDVFVEWPLRLQFNEPPLILDNEALDPSLSNAACTYPFHNWRPDFSNLVEGLSSIALDFSNTQSCTSLSDWVSWHECSRPLRTFSENRCRLCPLELPSNDTFRLHRLFHEGAHVDVLGHRIDPIRPFWIITPPSSSSSSDPVNVLAEMDLIEFKCGSSLSDGNCWGCKKIFPGIWSFVHHLRSPTGQICWAPLKKAHRHPKLSVRRLILEGRPSECGSEWPAVLLDLYPALRYCVGHPPPDRQLGDSEDGFQVVKDTLSTIASVTTHPRSHTRSVADVDIKAESNASLNHSQPNGLHETADSLRITSGATIDATSSFNENEADTYIRTWLG